MAKINIQTVGKRKKAVARASFSSGEGKIKINNESLDVYNPKELIDFIKEPLFLSGDVVKKINVNIRTKGGGKISQAQAIRIALAKGLVEYTKDENLKNTFVEYDKHMLVADVRQRESRKPFGNSKARSKRQKSYR
jgi:small subunit ribosomal protein S9